MAGVRTFKAWEAARGAALVVAAAIALTASSGLIASAPAMELEGLSLPEKVLLYKGGPQVVLNGAGVRHKLVTVKVYVGALYLATKERDPAKILSDPGPKRVSMYILIGELTARELIASLNDAIAANHIPAEIALIETRLREMNRMMGSIGVLQRGAVVHLDYLPGTGTRITVNGEEKQVVPGEDFFRALLRIWIGAKPVDGRLRDAMLGGGVGLRLF